MTGTHEGGVKAAETRKRHAEEIQENNNQKKSDRQYDDNRERDHHTENGHNKKNRGHDNDKDSSRKINPIEVERYLKGIHYPASKEDLVNQAESNEAPQEIIDFLNNFEDKEYGSTIDVTKEAGHRD